MSEFRFDPNHFSEAHAAEIDAVMEPVVREQGKRALERTLSEIAVEEFRTEEATKAKAQLGVEEAEQFANLGLIDGETPHNIGANAERMLRTHEWWLRKDLLAMLREVDPYAQITIAPESGQSVEFLPTSQIGVFDSRLISPAVGRHDLRMGYAEMLENMRPDPNEPDY
jgi:hypothetical protein